MNAGTVWKSGFEEADERALDRRRELAQRRSDPNGRGAHRASIARVVANRPSSADHAAHDQQQFSVSGRERYRFSAW